MLFKQRIVSRDVVQIDLAEPENRAGASRALIRDRYLTPEAGIPTLGH